MALYQPYQPKGDKLIFAPSPSSGSSSSAPAPAGQFTKHEPNGGLRQSDLDPRGPIHQFHAWFAEARAAGIAHPEACTFSTASLPSGRISSRMVYLKELDPKGFVLYSNFGTSQKAQDLETNKWASLVFFWESLERQVRVEGRAERLSPEESQVYYDTRVRGSRIGAWASRQSAVLEPQPSEPKATAESTTMTESTTTTESATTAESTTTTADDGRAQLESWVKQAEDRFSGSEHIPIPPFWGGLRIIPERIEFWQGRQNRLHDRFVFDREEGKDGEAKWSVKRLSP